MNELTNKFIPLITLVPLGKSPLGKQHLELSLLRRVRVQVSLKCFLSFLFFFSQRFIYLFERERERERESEVGGQGRESQADSLLSIEPDAGLCPHSQIMA